MRAAGAVVLTLAVVAFGHVCALKGGDFHAYYEAAQAALRRGDIYALGPRTQMHVPYPPYFALALAPLTLLPLYAAGWVWYLLKLALVVPLVRWVAGGVRAEAPAGPRRARVAYVALAFLALLNPFMSEFRLGQANLLVLAFSLLTVLALERGRPLLAAAFFSVAVVKVTPILLLPWFALRRQWRFFLAALPVAAAWLVALAAWWGPAAVPGLFLEWIRSTASHRTTYRQVAFFENQSLQGAAARLAGILPALDRPVLGLPAHQWLWIVPSVATLLVLAVVVARDRFRPRLPMEELAVGSLLMLLASADARYAHHVQLLVPVGLLVALGARLRMLERLPRLGPWLAGGAPPGAESGPARRVRRWVLGLLAATLAFYVLLGRDVFGPTVNHAVRSASLGTAIDVALLVFFAVRLLGRASDPAHAPARSLPAAGPARAGGGDLRSA